MAPVQRVPDFLAGVDGSARGESIQSSYRLGVREAPCHLLYPSFVTDALRKALLDFERQMPGFVCPEAILHGIETRTSAPVQITRSEASFECISLRGLYPIGEGAGWVS